MQRWFSRLFTALLCAGTLLGTVACQSRTTPLGNRQTFQGSAGTLPNSLPNALNALDAIHNAPSPPFLWGVSSAGYQSEGNERNSQWYYWELAGKTPDQSGKAVDFWNRYTEDIQLAQSMGVNTFRLSIEWSRIEPHPGIIDYEALAHYKQIIQTVRDHGMEPLVTLLHFTYPHWLDFDTDQDGLTGWEDPDTTDAFLNYASLVVREFSPQVKFWITFNEPNIWLPIAHLAGKTPPGKKNPISFLRAGYNVLQAHARVYDRIHGIQPQAMVSANIFQFMYNPFGRANAYASGVNALSEQNIEGFAESDWFMEALEDGEFAYQPHLPAMFEPQHFSGGLRAMNNGTVSLLKRFDYVAFDYYYRFTRLSQVFQAEESWRIPLYPEGLYDVLMRYHRRFDKPIIIAENGMSTENNAPRQDGWKRGDHIVQHVKYMKQAMADGAKVIGYYHWSITDNYEWGSFTPRFGLFQVEALSDPELKRVPTDGVAAYQAVIAANGVTPELLERYPGPTNP